MGNLFWLKWGFDIGAASCMLFFTLEFINDGFNLIALGGIVLVLFFILSPLIEILSGLFADG